MTSRLKPLERLASPRNSRRSPWARILRAALLLSIAALLCPSAAEAQLRKGRVFKSEKRACTDCHKTELRDYRGRKSTHAPVREGQCESCHQRHGVVGLNRLVSEDPLLCLSCHAPEAKAAATASPGGSDRILPESRLSVSHPPREGLQCGACHDPHGSELPSLLKQEDPASCLSCHEESAFQGVSKHPEEEVRCLTCHDPHGSERAGHLAQAPDALCGSCHQGTSQAERAAHGGGVPAGSACLSCHAPHASESEGLLRANVHAAMAEGGESCAGCHEIGGEGSASFPLMAEGSDLCLNCHEDPREPPDGAGPGFAVHVPLAGGECVTCHAPHAADVEGLLQQPQGDLCGTCHEEALKAAEARVPHGPAVGQCSSCHLPHGGDRRLLVRGMPGLCTACHDDLDKETGRSHVHPPAGEGECLTCHQAHGSDHPGILQDAQRALCLACHEDLQDDYNARFTHAPLGTGECSSCHEPHGSEAASLVVDDLGAACLSCHTESAARHAESDRHAPFGAGECLSCHESHSSSREDLLTTEPSLLCGTCHEGVGGEITAASRHLPVLRGQCLSCHGPHGGHKPGLMRRPDSRAICLSCHSEEGRIMSRSDLRQHPPFREGSCLECHAPHVSDHPGLLAGEPGTICTACHDIAAPKMTRAHKGLLQPGADCATCHEPHAGEKEGLVLEVQHAPFLDGDCTACHQGGASQ